VLKYISKEKRKVNAKVLQYWAVSHGYHKWIILGIKWVSKNYSGHPGYHMGIRVIRSKVRQTQHQNPQSWGGIQKTNNFGGRLSFILSFLFLERLHCCYIYFRCSYYSRTLCIKCWVSAFRTELQHFTLWFNKMSLLCGYHWKRG
jgi:hypothetical protein